MAYGVPGRVTKEALGHLLSALASRHKYLNCVLILSVLEATADMSHLNCGYMCSYYWSADENVQPGLRATLVVKISTSELVPQGSY